MDIAVLAVTLQAVAVAACFGWGARALSKQRNYRETCRVRLRVAAA